MPVRHPLADYLLNVPQGAGYVGEFDPTGVDYARQAPARRLGIMSQAMSDEAEETRLGDLAWANAPPTARSPVPPSQITDPAAPALALAELAPGSELARLGIQYAEGETPSIGQHALAGADAFPGGKSLLALIGSMWGTKKRHLFMGRGPESGAKIKEAGGSLRHAGAEVLAPNTSYSSSPTAAAAFGKIPYQESLDVPTGTEVAKDQARIAARMSPEQIMSYRIKNPKNVKNLAPDELIDIVAETGERPGLTDVLQDLGPNEKKFQQPTAPGLPDKSFPEGTDVGLYSFPQMAGVGRFAEKEVAAARDMNVATQQMASDLFDANPTGDPVRQLVETFHDPVLGKPRAVSRVTAGAARDRIRSNEAGQAIRNFELYRGNKDFSGPEFRSVLRDLHDRLLDPTTRSDTHSVLRIREYKDKVLKNNPEFSDVFDSLDRLDKARTQEITYADSYQDFANLGDHPASNKRRAALRKAHGEHSLARIFLQEDLKKVMGAQGWSRAYWPKMNPEVPEWRKK